jgi:L-amino acid N-acyltransferase YncA
MIRRMRDEDSQAVLEIYRQGIEGRNATFETEVPSWQDFLRGKLEHSRFVYLEREAPVGWAALSLTSSRKAYAGVAEASIYVDAEHRGKGIGDRLMRALIQSSEEHGIWTLSASAFAENGASLALLKKNGFRMVGRRERIARLDGAWRDTVLLERRSDAVV